ncbi:MAG: sulfatase-like hydrolase/transferase, partial [Myxococcales bacterium]|nr:sulfatase-like hydrolase/transferase [Myxococcales bacterium]
MTSTRRARVLSGLARIWSPWLVWLWATTLAAAILLVIDRVRSSLGPGHHEGLRHRALAVLGAGHLVAQVALFVCGLLVYLLWRGAGRWIRWRPVREAIWLPALLFALLAAWPLWVVGRELASGPWIAQQSYAWAVKIAPVVGGVAAAPVLAWLALRGPQAVRRPLLRWSLTLGLLLGALVAEVADHVVHPGLYPEYHLFAYSTAALLMLLGLRWLLFALPGMPHARLWRWPALPLAAAWLVSPVLWFGIDERTRADLVMESVVATDWIRTAMPVQPTTRVAKMLDALDVEPAPLSQSGVPEQWPRGLVDLPPDTNVVLVVFDAFRYDVVPPALPPEGNRLVDPSDTPFLHQWSEGAYRFANAYSASTVTRRAMPTMMRSIQVSDDPMIAGVSAAERIERSGRVSVAAVINYFTEGPSDKANLLLEDFQNVSTYRKDEHDLLVPRLREQLEGIRGEPFVAWVHLYATHHPGFADGHLLEEADGNRTERYVKSVRYIDQQFQRLDAMFGELGLREKTVFIVTSDHGEGLGDHGVTLHGPNLFEEATHVPLWIKIPGREGRLVEETVGTIDIMPTISDLLGEPPEPQDRGISLVPLMADPPHTLARAYYLQNAKHNRSAVVFDGFKLIHDHEADVLLFFDLGADREENRNIFDPDSELARRYLMEFIGFEPQLFQSEFADPDTNRLLRDKLDEIDPSAPGSALPLLLQLATVSRDPSVIDAALRIFDQTKLDEVRLLIIRHLFEPTPEWEQRVVGWFSKRRGQAELALVSALAAQQQPPIAQVSFGRRMTHYANTGSPDTWEPFLELLMNWPKSFKTAQVLETMLRRMGELGQDDRQVYMLIMRNVAQLKIEDPTHPDWEPLRAQIRALTEHPDPRIQAAAIQAASHLMDHRAVPSFKQRLSTPKGDVRARRALINAVLVIDGDESMDFILDIARTELTAYTVRRLGAVGTPAALPFLTDQRRNSYNSFTRSDAERSYREA